MWAAHISMQRASEVHELVELRDRAGVFRDRADAGERLARMLDGYRRKDALLLAIPAGGVPVAAEVAARWRRTLDVAVVSKILFPWTTEAGFGAVAFDGGEWIDERLAAHSGLSPSKIQEQISSARDKVRRRIRRFRGERPFPRLPGRIAIVIDDGLAAGSTMRAAIEALKRQGAERVVAAVPTGHERSVGVIAALAEEVFCANIRGGPRFAVADAYARWRDVDESEAAAILERFGAPAEEAGI